MNYFIIIYKVIVNHNQTYYGKVGRATNKLDQMLGDTKVAVEEGYVKMFPDAYDINVIIVKKRQTTLQEYLAFVKIAQGEMG